MLCSDLLYDCIFTQLRGVLSLPSRASDFGQLTNEMKLSLNKVIIDDTKARTRASEALDSVLLQKLHAVCVNGVSSDTEGLCVLRRFLTMRYEMNVESIDEKLVEAELLQPTAEEVLV